jgi:hypothetical protein
VQVLDADTTVADGLQQGAQLVAFQSGRRL